MNESNNSLSASGPKITRIELTPLFVPFREGVRQAMAAAFGPHGLAGVTALTFSQPMEAHHWLQASNPSERWKWDFMFQDLPPIKGDLDLTALPAQPGVIPLKEVK